MENWIKLSNKEDELVWDKVYGDFKFNPSTSDFPGFVVPSPFITYDISSYYEGSSGLDVYDDLEEKALYVFKSITNNDEFIYALDWQHPSYFFNPHLDFSKDEFGEWPVPIFPDGDYYFFIQKDFEWGYLGHPWERTITIFGSKLVNEFQKQKPNLFFNKKVRQG